MKFVLDLPWGTKVPGVVYWKSDKIHVYSGPILPANLRHFAPEPYSYGAWKEAELNGILLPAPRGNVEFIPREHQMEAARKIYSSFEQGYPGFLIADKTGLGKTLSVLAGLSAIAKKQGFSSGNRAKVLIVCPKSVIPQWRQTLMNYPIANVLLRPLVINYQSLPRLLTVPSTARLTKKGRLKDRQVARYGNPTVNWDYVIFDEAHYLKNYPSSAASLLAASLAQLEKPYQKGRSPFVIYSTATPGSSPLNFAIMAKILGPLLTNHEDGKKVSPKNWGEFLEKAQFAVKKGKKGYTWATVPWYDAKSLDPKKQETYKKAVEKAKEIQRKDSRRIGAALGKPGSPFIMRSPSQIAGWPEQQLIPYAVEMTSRQKTIYEEAWSAFRKFLQLNPKGKDPRGQLVQTLRYRQKASLLMVDAVADAAIEWVEGGNQVYISVEFLETLDQLRAKITKAGISVVEISGRNTDDREKERIRFQKGEAKVVISTVVAGISLHSNEILPDGSKATSDPRITVLHDVRQNPLDSIQALGRCHRDGVNSLTYIPYLERTIQEKIVDSFVNKYTNLNTMVGDKDATMLEDIFRAAAAKTTPGDRLS